MGFLPRVAGHKQGVEALRRCVKACVAREVRVLTVFAFSSENWNRPVEEVSGLMDLMSRILAPGIFGAQMEDAGQTVLLVPGEEALVAIWSKEAENDALEMFMVELAISVEPLPPGLAASSCGLP